MRPSPVPRLSSPSHRAARRAGLATAAVLALGAGALVVAPAAVAVPPVSDCIQLAAALAAGGTPPAPVAAPASADSVEQTITVGSTVSDLGVSPDGTRLYVTVGGSALQIYDITGTTPTLIDSVTGFVGGGYLAVSPDEAHVYVANTGNNTIAVVDVSSTPATISATVATGAGNTGSLALSPDGTELYSTHLNGPGPTNALVAAFSTAGGTLTLQSYSRTSADSFHDAIVSPDGAHLYVTGTELYDFDVSDPTAIRDPVESGFGGTPHDLAWSPGGTRLYVTGDGPGGLSVMSPTTPATLGSVGGLSSPWGMAVSPDGARAYVVNYVPVGTVSVVDVSTTTPVVLQTLSVGQNPTYVAITPDGTRAFVANSTGNTISVLALDTSPAFTTSPTLAGGTAGSAYTASLTASGSPAPTFAVTQGALPPGLGLDATTGAITGTPTGAGTFLFDVTAMSSRGTAVRTFSLTVAAAPTTSTSATPLEIAATGVDAVAGLALAIGLLAAGTLAITLSRRNRPHRQH